MKTRRFYSHWYFRMPWMKNYSGMVVGRFVLFRDPKELVPETLEKHEDIHQEQMDIHGVFSFYAIYIWDYFRGLLKYRNHRMAYLKIPFEEEAYRRQGEV